MSWQSYVDDQLLNTKMVTHAVICGHDGNIWATSADFRVSFSNLNVLIFIQGPWFYTLLKRRMISWLFFLVS